MPHALSIPFGFRSGLAVNRCPVGYPEPIQMGYFHGFRSGLAVNRCSVGYP